MDPLSNIYSFGSNLVSELAKYLRPVDTLALNFVSRRFYTKINWYDLIKNALIGRCYNPDNLIRMVKETGAVISGSFLLQVLYDVTWDDSDIDIFVMSESETHDLYGVINRDSFPELQLPRNLFLHEYEKESQGDTSDEGILKHVDFDRLPPNQRKTAIRQMVQRYSILPFTSYKYKHPKYDLIINWITINPKDKNHKFKYIHQYIDYFFDLSICKITFDGDILRLSDIDSIFRHRTKFNDNYVRYRIDIDGVDGGLLRSYKFQNPIHLIGTLAEKRKKKYEKRGFPIIPY